MCAVLGKSRAAYYKHKKRLYMKEKRRKLILDEVVKLRKIQPRSGTRKLMKDIRLTYSFVTRDKLFNLLREENMLVRRKKRYKKTTYSKHSYAVAPNRIKDLEITRRNQVLVSDITYLTLKRGFAYLFLTTDLRTRKVLGYHLSKDLTHYSAILALDMAKQHLDEELVTIHHSDRGSQYCCHDFLNYLSCHNIKPSMTDESHCYQNAVAERLNGILKDEFDLDSVFDTFDEAKLCVNRGIEIYNNNRRHCSLGYQTPVEAYYADN